MDVVYFVNSGSEANELAILIARLYTNAQEIISLCNGYHGGSLATQAATASSKWRYSMPQLPGFIHVGIFIIVQINIPTFFNRKTSK